jgi:DNA-binding response OmpR family regulator
MVEGPILIVDDDPLFRDTIGTALTLHGFPTRVAVDANDAIKAIESERPALLLLDVSVARLDGKTLLDELALRNIEVPVVILTAGSNGEAIARKYGVAAYLRKPVALPRLLDAIAACGRPGRVAHGRRDVA